MKKTILFAALAFIVSASYAQRPQPKQHVRYDTVKTLVPHVDFSPDTIPVYFEELVIHPDNDISNRIVPTWVEGYVIWQTYRKNEPSISFSGSDGSFFINSNQGFYTREYEYAPSMPGTFLYSDRKTHVKNKVIISLKR